MSATLGTISDLRIAFLHIENDFCTANYVLHQIDNNGKGVTLDALVDAASWFVATRERMLSMRAHMQINDAEFYDDLSDCRIPEAEIERMVSDGDATTYETDY
jgi:hypothetical protein